MEAEINKPSSLPWYEQIWDRMGLENTNSELSPYLDVDKFQPYQAKVVTKLIGQTLTKTPIQELKTMTPRKLGLVLGQQCATLYTLGDYLQSLVSNPESIKRGKANLKALRSQRHISGVSSVLHAGRIAEKMFCELEKNFPKFEETVHAAFRAALNQTSYHEAAEFFNGYAAGFSKPSIKDGKLVGMTSATKLQLKMFMHTEQAAECRNVKELRTLLLKNGFTEDELGDDERLQKFCHRIGYAPGKRGRPAKKK